MLSSEISSESVLKKRFSTAISKETILEKKDQDLKDAEKNKEELIANKSNLLARLYLHPTSTGIQCVVVFDYSNFQVASALECYLI